jgi:leucyl-tRNA---protein transferase
MTSAHLRLFKTIEHGCGYFPDRLAQNWVIDPAAPELSSVYGNALSQGFRRAGGHVYRPTCKQCNACTASRVLVQAFVPKRSQRRCARQNADLEIEVTAARYSDECFDLYRRYLESRHRDGGMDAGDPADFSRFLFAEWSNTRFLMFRKDGRLLACAVTDVTSTGLSAVYTFYDPELPRRGLGVFAILSQIEWARRDGFAHLYLGYWIAGHDKMSYKTDYQPIELLIGGRWQRQPAAAAPARGESASDQ